MTQQNEHIKKELAMALHAHIQLLQEMSGVQPNLDGGLLFTVRSFGFMLERIPEALISDDPEDLYYAAFQYYNLLTELKANLKLTFPQLANTLDLSAFPHTYVEQVNQWWENKTGLSVSEEPIVQTMHIDVQ